MQTTAKRVTVVFFCLFCLYIACARKEHRSLPVFTSSCPETTQPFPSYHPDFGPTEEWCSKNPGKAFRLSQNYNGARENTGEALPWKQFVKQPEDFRLNWKPYLLAVLRYSYEGNIERDWVVNNEIPGVRRWYHAPWMHSGYTGREFVRGLTMERSSCEAEMTSERVCDDDDVPIENWAVSLYNEPGGYFLGRVWREMYNPNLDESNPNPHPDPGKFGADGFPEGTVVVKLIFTQADADYLKDTIIWKADIYRKKVPPQKMRLLQIDVAVKDPDVSRVGWVFGTFVYRRNADPINYPFPLSEEQKAWLRVVPVGLMFGNDTEEFPRIREPHESLISDSVVQHQGCGGRLNGVIDNYRSSCISCHSLAEVAQTFEKIEYEKMRCETEEDTRYWFRNINPRSRDDAERTFTRSIPEKTIYSLDYSLQLRKGIERCCDAGVCKCKRDKILHRTEPQEFSRDGIF